MAIKVGINGYGTIGKRVADAVAMQKDMKLIGVTAHSYSFNTEAAKRKGYKIFTTDGDGDFKLNGINPDGDIKNLIEEVDIIVVKKDGRRERFERQKLLNGILKACEKRPISLEKIEKLVDEVESDLRKRDSVEVDSKIIGNLVMKKLKSLDKVAYIRFASVYLEFEDLTRFEEELDKLQKK